MRLLSASFCVTIIRIKLDFNKICMWAPQDCLLNIKKKFILTERLAKYPNRANKLTLTSQDRHKHPTNSLEANVKAPLATVRFLNELSFVPNVTPVTPV